MAIHATAVARRIGPDWCAVLLRGPSGSGKSDLALRLMQAGWRLVSDDYTEVWASGGRLFATAPERIAGRIEARGVGLIAVPVRGLARVALIANCIAEEPERLPPGQAETLAGVVLPRLALRALDASAPAKLAAALHTVQGGGALGA